MSTDAALAQIGPRLRAARQRRGLTLEELSTLAQISPSTLSRLESGKRQANLELLLPLTRALRMGIDDLVPSAIADPRVRQATTVREGRTTVRLSPPNSPVHTFKIRYARPAQPDRMRVHDGYDWVYVLSGRLTLLLDDQTFILEAGEAAEFDTRVPHSMGSTDGEPAEVLSIFGPEGERVHTATSVGAL